MQRKKHPFDKATLGDVFALSIGAGEHGYVRIYRGKSHGIFPVISTNLVVDMTQLGQHKPRWFFNCLVLSNNQVDVFKVGEIPFANQDAAWPPPRFLPPDIFRNFFRIQEFGMKRRATEAESAGLQKFQLSTLVHMQKFIQEHAGECSRLQGTIKPVKPAKAPVEDESGGNVFLEVVFQAHDFPFKGRDIPEDALADALEKAKLGEVTGGGSGRQTSAIDVEVTDFERGLKLIRRTLKKVGAPASTEIHRHRPKHEIYRLE